jgi:HlyD family secretion protein
MSKSSISPKSRWWRAGRVLMIAGLGAGVLASAYFLYINSVRPAQSYQTVRPLRATIRLTIVANGTLVPRKEVNVKPQMSGVIEKILVERGDIVRVGDLLAMIRPLPNPSDVNAAESELRNARIARAHAKQEFDRSNELFKRNLIPRADNDKLKTDLQLAEERVTAAQRRLEIVQTGASADLGRSASEVRATIAGMVLERPVEIGAFVIETNTFNDGTTIVSIADMSDLIFKGKVDEPDAGNLRVGMPASVAAGALDGERFQGKLDFIAPKSTDKDGLTTFEIRVTLKAGGDRMVRAGYSATAEFVVAQRDQVLTLPERYVRFRKGRAYVAVETAPGKSEEQVVTLGLSDGINTEITSGLSENDRVRAD